MLSKSKKYLFISVPLKDRVVFMDIKKRCRVHKLIFKDDIPKYLALSKDGSTLYVSAQQSKKLYVVSLNDLR